MKKVLFLCLLVSNGAWADDEYEQYLKQRIADSQARSAQLSQEMDESIERLKIESKERSAQYWTEHHERFSKPSATIGMTESQVINNTYWGKPSHKNFTTTRSGTREQWVYPNVGYVYFENGKVVAIQNY